ncbi:MAG: hypothetical protein ACKPKO_20710 [Candidatus Fonsibacter sp.]
MKFVTMMIYIDGYVYICMGGGEPATALGQLRQACTLERRRANNGTRPAAASQHAQYYYYYYICCVYDKTFAI